MFIIYLLLFVTLWRTCLQISPPWKPDINNPADTKYIPEEFASEPVQLTPPTNKGAPLDSIDEDEEREELPYFESFSYHGSRGSLGSYLSGSGASSNAFYNVECHPAP